jgi:hypothetical protein
MLMECDDPLEVHKFCSMLPAFTFEARPVIPVADAIPLPRPSCLMIALAAILGILSFAVVRIYASINWDPILIRTTNHTPGSSISISISRPRRWLVFR